MSTTQEYAIDIKGVTKIFGPAPIEALTALRAGMSKAELQTETGHVVGLDGVSLQVTKGQIHVVMGLSGSGKSTLIRHVNRLIEPTAGEITVYGANVLDMSLEQLREYRRTRVAMVFQKFGLLPHRSVVDNVGYGLEVRGAQSGTRGRSAKVDRDRWFGGLRERAATPAVRRTAAASRACSRIGARYRHPADGRGVLGARSADPA